MSAKPTSVARWADTGGAIVVPPSGKQDVGWVAGEAPPAEYFNWIENLAYQWQKWLFDGNCTFAALGASTFSVTGASTFTTAGFTGLLTASAGITIPTGQALTLAGTASLTVGGAATFNGAATFSSTSGFVGLITASGGITVVTGQALTLAGTASLSVGGAATFTGTATFNGALVANGNVTLGDASSDTLTVNATTSHAAPTTFNANATVAAGSSLTITDGAGALKGMTANRSWAIINGAVNVQSGSVSNSSGTNTLLSANGGFWIPIPGVATHETITSLAFYFAGNSIPNVSNMTLVATDSQGNGQNTAVTGITFNNTTGTGTGGVSWLKATMTGTPSITLKPTGAMQFYLFIQTNAGGTTVITTGGYTVTT